MRGHQFRRAALQLPKDSETRRLALADAPQEELFVALQRELELLYSVHATTAYSDLAATRASLGHLARYILEPVCGTSHYCEFHSDGVPDVTGRLERLQADLAAHDLPEARAMWNEERLLFDCSDEQAGFVREIVERALGRSIKVFGTIRDQATEGQVVPAAPPN